ncbi:hypothetical protein [Desnuesiella massiliensis]|uniref:hypothetical protein n=1 Tax=Desnuesiella massiliensis TaxID=1650662 RepID=UPI0006E2EC28|nr:hypothetical protein [Desnuesiella massiliensis]
MDISSEEYQAKNNILSFKGLIFSLLATLGILVVQEIVNIFMEVRYLDVYFVIGWGVFPFASSVIYSKFATGRENFACILLIAFLNFSLPHIFYYFADVFMFSMNSGISYYEALLSVPIYSYMSILFYYDVITIAGSELTTITLLAFRLLGFCFYIYFTKREIYKVKYSKMENFKAIIEKMGDKMTL